MPERIISLLLLAGLNANAVLAVAPPPVPPYQRLLSGQQARQARRLQQEVNRLEARGEYRDAAVPAQQLADLRSRLQGAQHWQAIDAREQVRWLRLRAGWSAKQRADHAEVMKQDRAARQLEDKGRYRDAEPLLRRALDGVRKLLGEEHPDTASACNNLAYNLHRQSKYTLAQPLYEKALAIFRKALGDEHPRTAFAWNNVAFNLEVQDKLAQAQPAYEKALGIFSAAHGEEHSATTAVRDNLAANLQRQRKYAAARPLFERALAIKRKVLGEEHLETATSCNNLAFNLNAQGQHKKAQQLYEKTLAIRRKVQGEEHPDTLTCCNNLAACLDDQGEYTQAQPLYEKTLAIRRRLLGEEHLDTVVSRSNLAYNLNAQGKSEQAQAMHEKVVKIRRKRLGEEHADTARSYNNLAICLSDQGKFAQALLLYEKALLIWRKLLGEDHADTAISYNNVAFCLNVQGKHPQAQALYEKALQIRRKRLGEDHADTARSYNNLALCLADQGRFAQAQPAAQKAVLILGRVLGDEHPDTATSCNNLAYILNRQGRHEQAQSLYEKALAIYRQKLGEDHPLTAGGCNNVASNLFDLGKHEQAQHYFEKALALRRKALGEEHPLTAFSYSNLAACLYERGQKKAAEKLAERACRSFQLALLHVDFAGLDRAAFRTRSSLSIRNSPQLFLAFLRARSGQADAAWMAFEQYLARGLLDEIAARHRIYSAEQWQQLASLRSRWQVLDQQLLALANRSDAESRRQREWLRERLDAAGRELRDLQARLAKEHGPVAGAILDRKQIQQSMPDDTALLGFLDVRSESWACLLRRRGAVLWVRLDTGNPADSEDLALELSRPAVEPAPTWTIPAQRLYRQRLAPLLRHLAARDGLPVVRHLVVLPSPALAEVPIETLLAAGKADLTVSYAPSGTLFAFLRQRESKAHPARLLALGDPLFAQPEVVSTDRGTVKQKADTLLSRALRQSFAPLPGTRGEVEAIARLFPSADTLLGARASEETFDDMVRTGKLKGYRLLHLATHGQANQRRPLESFLALSDRDLPDPLSRVLAGKPARTGRLTAGQILQSWDLDADLVVLSACQSGLGRYEGGEGYVGFAQPLFACGARSLVMSLWSVGDKATALLMVRFYQNLLGKRQGLRQPLGKAEALAEAKRWLRSLSNEEADRALTALSPKLKLKEQERPRKGKPFEHPFFWAAFILAGDPGPIRLSQRPRQ
jgi:CHAT domain-containing protein/tetratricopeptide (TPR) repeat protein